MDVLTPAQRALHEAATTVAALVLRLEAARAALDSSPQAARGLLDEGRELGRAAVVTLRAALHDEQPLPPG